MADSDHQRLALPPLRVSTTWSSDARRPARRAPAVHTDSELPSGPRPGVAAKFSFGPVALIR